jgi:hypothetical protein
MFKIASRKLHPASVSIRAYSVFIRVSRRARMWMNYPRRSNMMHCSPNQLASRIEPKALAVP